MKTGRGNGWRMALLLTAAVVLSTTAIALGQSQTLDEDQEPPEDRCPEMMPGYPWMPPDDFLTPTMFLRVEPLSGGATHGEHEGEIEVFGWNWNVHRFEDMPFYGDYGGFPGEGQTLEVHKRLDRATPGLIHAALEGTSFQEAVLIAREPGEEGAEILRITMSEVSVAYMYTGRYPGEGNYPSEHVSLSFNGVRVEYLEPDGETFSFDWSSR